jgi:hypothetical protein
MAADLLVMDQFTQENTEARSPASSMAPQAISSARETPLQYPMVGDMTSFIASSMTKILPQGNPTAVSLGTGNSFSGYLAATTAPCFF